jgi:beta-aspartyl-peptidase (threonine type)
MKPNTYSIAIHGGAGTILKSAMTSEKEEAYNSALKMALQAGESILKQKGSAIDAVSAAIIELENCPLFNAGKGAVFTHTHMHELDASIMRGDNLMAGAVAGVRNIKNPIQLARMVMEKSEHVLLGGQGAADFAKTVNVELAPDSYFYSEERHQQWLNAVKEDRITMDHDDMPSPDKKFGTVGAVARDIYGNLAAGTSTGGMTNKKFGRIGDSPVIGAGTYANNLQCAVSCTGHGEYFIKAVVAYDVFCLMEYKQHSLEEACRIVVKDKLVKLGGEGGLIAVDKFGNVSLCFNSEGMYRASSGSDKELYVGIYKD